MQFAPANRTLPVKNTKKPLLSLPAEDLLIMDPVRISTISSKGQTTVPVAIRRSLDLHPGDAIAYEVDGDKVRIHKASRIDLEWARALERTLTEWQDGEDDDL